MSYKPSVVTPAIVTIGIVLAGWLAINWFASSQNDRISELLAPRLAIAQCNQKHSDIPMDWQPQNDSNGKWIGDIFLADDETKRAILDCIVKHPDVIIEALATSEPQDHPAILRSNNFGVNGERKIYHIPASSEGKD